MGSVLSFCWVICTFLFSDFFIVLLWIFSFFYFYKLEKTSYMALWKTKLKVKDNKEIPSDEKVREENTVKSSFTSIDHAENYIDLLLGWIFEQDNSREESLSPEEHLSELQISCKVLKKIQIAIESIRINYLYGLSHNVSTDDEFQRKWCIVERFEHIKAYIALRLYMMKVFMKHLNVWLEELKGLKMCISEAMEIQEKLHSVACETKSTIEHHLNMQEVLSKESMFMKQKLENCETATCDLTIILKETGWWSKKFHQSMITKKLEKRAHEKRWNDILCDSITEEMVHVAAKYSSFAKLNRCYSTHLEGLLKMAFQEPKTPQPERKSTHCAVAIFWKQVEIQESISKDS